MKKIVAALLTIILILACIYAVIKPHSSSTTEVTDSPEQPVVVDTHSQDGETTVGISMPDKLLERWNKDGAYLRTQFERNGCKVMLRYANNLIDTQIDDILYMIQEGADLLVIAAVDGSALTDVLEIARSANVKIIAYDRLIMDSDVVDYYVSFDNYKVGVLQAKYIIRILDLDHSDAARHIEFVTGDPVDNNARYFYNGAMDTIKPYLDSGKLIPLSGQVNFYETSTAQWSTDIAQQRLQIILNSYYPEGTQLDAVLCANDSTALGATRALESDYTSKNPVAVTGQDADIANIYNILNGTQGMTVFKALTEESVVTVTLALAILDGQTPSESLITNSDWSFKCTYNTTDYFNGQEIVPSYLLEPIVVTADNIESQLFDTGYYRRNSAGLIYAAK